VLDARVRDELEALLADMRRVFAGLSMRMKGKDGISRAIYVTVRGRRVVVVRVFIKKTQKTPRREIDLALERAKEVKP
jgi:phage-related protein